MWKSILNRMLRGIGYEIHRVPSGGSSRDPFRVQEALLSSVAPLTIFDVGACRGQTALKYASLFPEATIYCFEPFPESFERLKVSIRGHDSIKPYPLAIADFPGKKTFYINQMSATNSLLPRPRNFRRYYPRNAETVGRMEVEATTLDAFCQEQSVSRINILKMDIQGGELLALEGATGLLSRGYIDLIYTEVMFIPHYEGCPMFYQLWEFLARYGYSLYDLSLAEHGTNGQLRYGDAMFISKSMRTEKVDQFIPEP